MTAWHGKVALVSGASRGLGLHVARALCRAGVQVVLAARGAEELQRAADSLNAAGGQAVALAADVTQDESVTQLVAAIQARFGRLDLLCNAVGVSMRRAVLDTTPADFAQSLELNLLTAVRCTRACVPLLREHAGHVVNIGSLAGKSASRFLGAYPASKFALSAYSQQLRLELTPLGVHVLLVCPGPIAREDALERYNDQGADLPQSARRPGGGVKLRAIDPAWLAEQILRACERRQAELIVPGKARWLFALQQLWPALGDWILLRKTSS